VAVIDPGPEVESHFRALVRALGSPTTVTILLTHGHRDHAELAPHLAKRFGATIQGPGSYAPPQQTGLTLRALQEGDRVETDQGDLVVMEVPGHTRDHLAFHWSAADALFVGDLVLGRGNTTWIGEYDSCVGDYLRSLEKVRALDASVLYPGHGPPITFPSRTLDRFRRHRLERVEEVRRARELRPGSSPEELARLIYGQDIPESMMKAARASVDAALLYLGPR